MLKIEKYGAVDIGSNAIRLLVVTVIEQKERDTIFKKTSLVRVPIRLGAEVFLEGKISENSAHRMIDAMQAFRLLMKTHNVKRFRACATSAMREASNGSEIAQTIEQKSGISINIIDGKDEAAIIASTDLKNLIQDEDAAQQLITQLGSLGCTFALDDFGSGFSSFGQLKHLDVDYIKIDGLFIQGLVSDPMDRHVVLAITQIAHSLGKKTVAEFVETLEVMEAAHKCGVDYIQGHCVGPARRWSQIHGR